jgi:hypothetical protein
MTPEKSPLPGDTGEEATGDEVADRLLGRLVGFGYRSQVGLCLDAQVERPEAGEGDRVGGICQLVCEA